MPQIDSGFLQRLLETFRLEAEEHISTISSGLVELEGSTLSETRHELIETVFREAHSLKGAARSVNLVKVETVCQSLETLLSHVKAGTTSLCPELFDNLHHLVSLAVAEIASAGHAPVVSPSLGRSTNDAEPLGTALASLDSSLTGETRTSVLHDRGGLSDTVRVAASRLGGVLLQAEELYLSKTVLDRFSAQLHAAEGIARAWDSDWKRFQRTNAGTAVSTGDFLERNERAIRCMRDQLRTMRRSLDHDRRVLDRQASDLLDDVKRLTMLPFSLLLEVFPKLVRDLSRDCGKEADLVIRGGDIEAERRILEEIKDPLIHLIRNSIDHGIESPTERLRAGKRRRGTITIDISPGSGDRVEIAVSDDGRGIDLQKVRAAAVRQGSLPEDEAKKLDDGQAAMLIFISGLSTQSMITDISGRGLGMAIVRDKIVRMGGEVSVRTQPGAGTTFRLTLALTAARFRSVLVRAGELLFAIPSMQLQRALRIDQKAIGSVQNRPAAEVDGRTVAVVWLSEVLGEGTPEIDAETSRKWQGLLVEWGGQRIVFLVDEILLDQEVLVKSLGRQLHRVRNILGAAVLANGQVVPVLNVADLMRSATELSPAVPKAKAAPSIRSILIAEDSFTSRMLLKNILESTGYSVATAVDGAEAFQMLEKQAFDLVISDVEMPRMSGFELTTRIRAHRKLKNVPVILVTALDSREDRERGAEAGANAYIVKSSFEQSNLLEVVDRLI